MSNLCGGGIKIVSCSGHVQFAKAVASYLGLNLAKTSVVTMPNGELVVSIGESLRDQDVYICQTGYGNINDLIMELLITISGCRAASARRITVGKPLTFLHIAMANASYTVYSNTLFSLCETRQKGQRALSNNSQVDC